MRRIDLGRLWLHEATRACRNSREVAAPARWPRPRSAAAPHRTNTAASRARRIWDGNAARHARHMDRASCRWICSRRAAWRKLRAAAARAVRTARRRGHGFTSIGLSRLTVGAPSCGTWHTSSCRNQHRRAATSIAVTEHGRVKLPRRVEVDLLLPLPAAYKAAQLLSMRPALLLLMEATRSVSQHAAAE